MQATSIIDIYTSVLGWHINNNIWSLLESSGLMLIPFIAIIIRNFIKAREQNDDSNIGVLVFHLSETQFYVMFFTILLLIKPTIYLDHEIVNYSDQFCSSPSLEADEKKTWGDTGSTLDRQRTMIEASLEGQRIKIPILWYPLEYYARAFTESAKFSLPCQPNLRAISEKLTSARISDPHLSAETQQFHSQCWVPSSNRYIRDRIVADPIEYPNINDDISWMGSRFFSEHPYLYHRDRARVGLDSFPYNERRDGMIVTEQYSGGLGWPFCAEWWLSEEHGLRRRLIEHFRVNYSENGQDTLVESLKLALYSFESSDFTNRESGDLLLKYLLKSDLRLQTQNLSNNYTREQTGDTWDKITSGISQNIMGIGLTVLSGSYSIEMQTYQYAATVIQALMIMLLTLTLPILSVIAFYRLDIVCSLLLLKFSVIFWGFLFHLAFWLDNFLLDGLMDHTNSRSSLASFGAFMSGFDPTVDIINYITQSLYVLLPIVFSSLMGVVGYGAGGSIGAMVSRQGSAPAGAARSTSDKMQTSVLKK